MSQARLQSGIDRYAATHAPSNTPIAVSLLGLAMVQGRRFAFNGHNNAGEVVSDLVELSEPREAWGALYEVNAELVIRSDGRRSVLDRIEGHRRDHGVSDTYLPMCIEVTHDGVLRHAWTYICSFTARRCPTGCIHQATAEYVKAILDGAQEIGVPQQYLEFLIEEGRRAVAR